LETREA